ncbi:uncharacterized protein K02A2.6-like [Lineus longissimus]|uniref:uncharacterized protein K02A2.6-like n=1 Tax=Lineus longissimus TaxID=88925 RepID=UPI00315C5908
MVQYLSRFIPDYAHITAPLRELTRQDTKWEWTEEHDKALNDLKEALTGAKVMSYYNPDIDVEVAVDTSPKGLGAMLTQRGKVISYGSKILTDVETRYSQTEQYRPGKDDKNPADFMSRHPVASSDDPDHTDDYLYINYLCTNAIPKAMTFDEVQACTNADPVLQKVKKSIETGNWPKRDDTMRPFYLQRDQFAVHNGAMMTCSRLVIPKTLQKRAVELAHVGHQGIVKTKSLLREKIWFPGIDALVEEEVRQCLPCQAASSRGAEKPEPLKMTPLPKSAWKETSIDFFGPLPVPTADYLMVLIDDYSRFPEIEIIASTAAKTVIPKRDARAQRAA